MAPMINCDSGRMAWNAHPHAALLDGGIAVSNIHASFALRSARRRLHDDGLLCHDRRRAGPQDEPAHKTRARDEKLYCTGFTGTGTVLSRPVTRPVKFRAFLTKRV